MKRLILAALLLAAPAAAAPLTTTKTSTLVSDPIDGVVVPKRIPGALVDYNIRVNNPNGVLISVGGISVSDHVPAGTDIFLGDLGPAGSGPVEFTDGNLLGLGLLGSGLDYSYGGLGAADSLEFSNNNGASYTYTPSPVGGYDSAVTDIRVRPSGGFAAGSSFNLRFRVRVR